MGSATSIIKLSLQSNQYEQGLRGAKRKFEDFTASIGINMKKMTAYGLAAGAAASAINSLVDTIGTAISEGTRMASEMEGVRAAFKRLDQPGLLDNLREATHGTVNDLELMKQAVKFDNFNLSLEQMGTMLAFAQQQAKDTGQDVGYLVDSIVTGLGRKSLPILDNLGLSATEIKDRMKETGDMTKAVADIIKERMEAAGGYVETASDRAAKATADLENAMTSLGETFAPVVGASDSLWNSIKIGAINALNTAVKPLIQALSEAGALGKGARSTAGFNKLGGNSKIDRMIGRLGNGKTAGAYSIYTQQLGEFDKYINNKRFQIAAYGGDNSSVAQSAKARLQTELDGALKMRAEYVKRAQELHNQVPSPFNPATTSGGATGGGSNKNGIDAAGDWDKAFRKGMIDTDKLKEAKELISPFAMLTDEAKKQMLGLNEATRDWGGAMAEIGNQKVLDEIEAATKRIEQQQKATDLAAQSAMNLGAALSNIEDPGMKAAGTVLSAVANIALGFSQAAAQASSLGPYAWIAYLAAGTAAMATTISTIHSLTGYAHGGIVDGNSYSGDNIPIMANAGELVLTKAAQASLANHLEGGGMSGLGPSRISGEQIYITLNRYLKRSGQGELTTWG